MKNLLLWGIVIYGCVYDRVRDRGSEGGEGALLKVNVFGDSQCLALDGSAGLTIFSISSQSNGIRKNIKKNYASSSPSSHKCNPTKVQHQKIILDSNVLPYQGVNRIIKRQNLWKRRFRCSTAGREYHLFLLMIKSTIYLSGNAVTNERN